MRSKEILLLEINVNKCALTLLCIQYFFLCHPMTKIKYKITLELILACLKVVFADSSSVSWNIYSILHLTLSLPFLLLTPT